MDSGKLTLVPTNTASSSSTLSFTSISSAYEEYIFLATNIHPSSDASDNAFRFQGSTNGGSSYGVTKTTTHFRAQHREDNASADVAMGGAFDEYQSTAHQWLAENIEADNDGSVCSIIHLFDPSDTTFVKHFMARTVPMTNAPSVQDAFVAGYFNTTSAIDAMQFSMESGNMDSGTILMFGVS